MRVDVSDGVEVVVVEVVVLMVLVALLVSWVSLVEGAVAGASLAIAKTTTPQNPLIVNLSPLKLLSSLRYVRIPALVQI